MATKTKTSYPFVSTISTASSRFDNAPAAFTVLEERQAHALAALKENYDNRLAQLEARLAAAERATADLGGQLREQR